MHSSRSQKPSNWTTFPLTIESCKELSEAAAQMRARVARIDWTAAMGKENMADWS